MPQKYDEEVGAKASSEVQRGNIPFRPQRNEHDGDVCTDEKELRTPGLPGHVQHGPIPDRSVLRRCRETTTTTKRHDSRTSKKKKGVSVSVCVHI